MDGALTSYSSQDPAGAKASPVPPCIQALNHDTTQVGGRTCCKSRPGLQPAKPRRAPWPQSQCHSGGGGWCVRQGVRAVLPGMDTAGRAKPLAMPRCTGCLSRVPGMLIYLLIGLGLINLTALH